MRGDLGDFLAQGGAIVGGATALGAALGSIAGSVVHDFRPETGPDVWARKWGPFFGVGGLAVFIERL